MAKPIDIIGERFGNLVVVGRAENNSRGNTQWICKCDCGNVKTCLGYDLTHGRVVTCGCSINMKGKPSKKRISLVGNKYGKLTVVSLNEELSSTNALVWNCLCDCGNTFTARGGNLKYGKATHCGCSKKEFPNNFKDLTGIRFGKLTVVKMYSHERKNIKWLCKCDCGEDVIFTGSQLKKGKLPPCLVEERNKKSQSPIRGKSLNPVMSKTNGYILRGIQCIPGVKRRIIVEIVIMIVASAFAMNGMIMILFRNGL